MAWYNGLFHPCGPASFIPVQRIANRFAYHVLSDEQLIICPYVQNYTSSVIIIVM